MKGAKGKGAARVSQEALKPVDDRKAGKRKAAAAKLDSSSKRQAKREKQPKKDPNKPKRPPSAFFVFLEEFRKTFKKENPNVTAVSAVGKAAGEKWKSMSAAEKAPYESKAGKLKTEYGKQMNAYNKKQESNDGDEASDKSKSEVNDEDEASGEEEHQPQAEPEPEPEQEQDEDEDEDEEVEEEEDEDEEDDDD